ncbi:MAG: alpha/beta hydrolase [bacterium]|jgi:pimeloyl-ACP methyl ester carboxylesterase|nr:alpha/beta hydrolase [bacterium]
MPEKTGMAEVNRTSLYYEMMGEGQPLVLIHGGLLDSRMWDGQFKAFSPGYNVIRYDIRGYGKSALPKGKYSHVKDLQGLLKFLGIEQAHIIGLSLGGTIAIDFALDYPGKVSSLILVSAVPVGLRTLDDELTRETLAIYELARNNNSKEAIARWLDHPVFKTIPLKSRKKIQKMISDNLPSWMLPQDSMIWSSPPAAERLSKIKASTLIIVGEKDVPDILSAADLLENKIGVAIKMSIADAGHHINIEKPRQFNSIVLDFLSYL